MDAVFNDTVNIIEIDEGFDHYTSVISPHTVMSVCFICCCVYRFFMYVFMITGLSLLMFVIHYVYTTVRRVSIINVILAFVIQI